MKREYRWMKERVKMNEGESKDGRGESIDEWRREQTLMKERVKMDEERVKMGEERERVEKDEGESKNE